MTALDEDAYRRVIIRLKDFFSLILLDCGTGLQDPALSAAIAGADQVVLLTDAPAGHRQPGRRVHRAAASVGTADHRGGEPDAAQGRQAGHRAAIRYLPAARGLVVVPDDVVAATRLATGRFNWRDAPESWQYAVRRLATVLVADWERLGLARHELRD